MPPRRRRPRRPAGENRYDIQAPVGNRHPDTSWEAADIATRGNDRQRRTIHWMFAQTRRHGLIDADNARHLYNDFFQPDREIIGDMASRLQELRGESKTARSVYDPPWIEYIHRQPLDSSEKLFKIRGRSTWPDERRRTGIVRINCNGHWALVQRTTNVPKARQSLQEEEDRLIEEYGEEEIEKFRDAIRHDAGYVPRLVRPGENS